MKSEAPKHIKVHNSLSKVFKSAIFKINIDAASRGSSAEEQEAQPPPRPDS